MIEWLHQAVSDSQSNRVSSKRVCMLLACVAMAISLVILSLAAFYGRVVDVAIGAVSASLAGLGGYSYVGGKSIERKQEPK